MRLRMASRCLHLVLVLALLGQGVSSGLLLAYDVAPRSISDATNALPAPEEQDGATAPPEQTRDGTQLEVRLARETLTADGRDSALLVVLATDARGQPVPDGTRLMLEARGGRLSEQELQTTDGLAHASVQAGQMHGRGQVTVRAGEASASATFHLQPVEDGMLRLDESAATGMPERGEARGAPFDDLALPAHLAELVERARNSIHTPERGLPEVETPAHRAQFDAGQVAFTPLDHEGEAAPDLTVTLSGVAVGGETLFVGPQEAEALVEGNVARYERAPGLVEEFVARDAGVEQRWWLHEAPATAGALVITVDVETALTLTRAPRGEGFLFRSADPSTDSGQAPSASSGQAPSTDSGQAPATAGFGAVAAYGRAVAIDAGGRSLHAGLSSETLESITPGLNRYRLTMTFNARWLAQATYPLLVDPLIGSQLRLDGSNTQAGAQRRTAVAYNSADDEYLVVWEDNRESTTRIYGQRVAADGVLLGNNFNIALNNNRHYLTPDVAYNPDDNNYLVTWHADNGQVFARPVSAAGATGTTQPLSTPGYTFNSNTAVAYSASAGAWLVVWQRTHNSTGSEDIGARWVDSAGNRGTAFVVAANGSADETAPDVAANNSGGFLVAWEQATSGSVDLYAQRTTTTTVPGSAFALTTAGGTRVAPALTYNADDDQYLAVWQDGSDGTGGSGYDAIWGQRVYGTSAAGALAGSAFEVSGAEEADSSRPALTYFEDSGNGGLYLVAWEQTVSGGALDLQARRVLTSGVTSGSVITLSNAISDQQEVALAFGPVAGQTLAAWIDERADDPDVYARLAQFDGGLEEEFLVHTVAGNQEAPQVAYNPDDDEYLVVWHDTRNGAGNGDIYGQRLSGSGVLVGGNITVTVAGGDQLYPQVAYAPGEEVYLVAWRSYISNTIYYDVAGQRLAADGSLLGGELLIGDSDGDLYRDGPSDVVYNSASDKFLVLWEETDAYARHVAVNGTMDAVVEVTDETGIEYGLRAAYNPDDDQYLLVWEQFDPIVMQVNILGRRMTGAGVVTSTETIAIATGTPEQTVPDVAYLPEAGRYAVVWQDARNDDTQGTDIYGQLVTPAGGLEGSNFQIGGTTQDEEGPRIEAGGLGGALVVWQHDAGGANGVELYGRRLGASGQTQGPAFSILLSAEDQDQAALAGDPSAGSGQPGGQFFLAWRDARNDGLDVYGSLFQYLEADFSATPTSGTAPLVVQFTDTSAPANAAGAWSWSFGDGGASAAQHPVYTYTVPGTYTVTLAITDTTTGETDALVQTGFITVTESATLAANFSASPLSGSVPLTVTFTNASVGASGYLWQFGDGITSTVASPNHVYTQAGIFTVTLTASGLEGSDTLTRTNYITATGPSPAALFTATPLTGTAPLTVTFSNLSTNADNYLWQFGDGITSTVTAPVHTYEQGGVYTVILTANGLGGSDTITRTNYLTITRSWRPAATTTDPAVWGEYAAAYDSKREVVVLYGGNASGWPYENSTWEYDGSDWTTITTTLQPAAVYGTQAIFDSEQDQVLLFGGSDSDDAPVSETRIYSGTAWTALAPAQSPPARTNHALAYDPLAGNSYLFGGNAGSAYFDDLWRYESGAWTQVVISGTAPAARALSALIYDATAGRLLLFGGRDATGAPLADLWAFDTSASVWTELTASGPAARYAHALAYDPASGAAILVGGVADAGDAVFGDAWQFQNGAWRELEATPFSEGVAYHTLIYHESARAFVLLTGGETWEYR